MIQLFWDLIDRVPSCDEQWESKTEQALVPLPACTHNNGPGNTATVNRSSYWLQNELDVIGEVSRNLLIVFLTGASEPLWEPSGPSYVLMSGSKVLSSRNTWNLVTGECSSTPDGGPAEERSAGVLGSAC